MGGEISTTETADYWNPDDAAEGILFIGDACNDEGGRDDRPLSQLQVPCLPVSVGTKCSVTTNRIRRDVCASVSGRVGLGPEYAAL
jgi:hypothetical protein